MNSFFPSLTPLYIFYFFSCVFLSHPFSLFILSWFAFLHSCNCALEFLERDKNWLVLSRTPLPLYCRLKTSFCMLYTLSAARSFIWCTCRLFCWCWIANRHSTVWKFCAPIRHPMNRLWLCWTRDIPLPSCNYFQNFLLLSLFPNQLWPRMAERDTFFYCMGNNMQGNILIQMQTHWSKLNIVLKIYNYWETVLWRTRKEQQTFSSKRNCWKC